MSASTTILVVVLVLVVAAAILLAPSMRSRTRAGRLRRRFGPEYDRLAARRGDSRAAEQELTEVEREHRALELRPLDEQSRDRYAAAWADAQAGFVDDPAAAGRQAERIVGALLTAMGYPGQDPDKQLALAALEYPTSLAEYRRGYDLVHPEPLPERDSVDGDSLAEQDNAGERSTGTNSTDDSAEIRRDAIAPSTNGVQPASSVDADGDIDAETEVMRQAMLHYRVFFEDLLGRSQQTVAS